MLRAGEAPRLLAFDDALGCPVETALAALEWTGAVGILLDDDCCMPPGSPARRRRR